MRDWNVVNTRCPVVRTEDGPWARWVDLSGGADVMGRVDFSKSMSWVRETTSFVRVRYADGSTDDEFGSRYVDYYGYGSSVQDVVDDARRVSVLLAASPGSALRVEALCVVHDMPLIPAPGMRPMGASLPYLPVPGDWRRADDPWLEAAANRGPIDAPDWTPLPDPEPIETVVVAEVVIWSSTVPDATEEAEVVLDAAHARLVEGLPSAAATEFGERWSKWRSGLWRDVLPRRLETTP